MATGVGGLGFHLYNVGKREDGFDFQNLFYGAPLGAPIAITLAGLAGLAASRLILEGEHREAASLLGLPAGPLLAFGSAAGLIGTVGEAALLHFRGAFHNPFMFLPVTLPPVTALVLALAAFMPGFSRWARLLLRATAAMGIGGAGFHAYGVQRNMGGFRNWSQNLLNGPPLPAPPSFTGVALAGLAAVKLMEATMTEIFHNRYPDYDVLDKWDSPSWNEQTRAVIHKRLNEVPDRRFFTETEWEILAAVCDR